MISMHLDDLSSYADHGLYRLRRAVDPAQTVAMARSVWAELERIHDIQREDRSTWTKTEPKGLAALRATGVFDPIATPAVRRGIAQLVGEVGPHSIVEWGNPLVTLPTRGEWAVPGGGWHLDYPVRGAPTSALCLKWLVLLEDVAPGGGGTVALAGSHRLVAQWNEQASPHDPGKSAAVRDAIFATSRWFDVLRRAPSEVDPDRERQLLVEGATVHGVDVVVVELVGEAGDLYFMHPHVLHAAAPNRITAPRVMTTGGIYTVR